MKATEALILPARRGLALLVLAWFWTGCARNAPGDLEALYRQVKTTVEAGDLLRATDLADRGRELAAQRHDKLYDWRFRLLEATVLLLNRRAEPALPLLEGSMPDLPEFAAPAAERLLLQSRALSYLHRTAEADALLARAQQAAEAAHATRVLTDVQIARGLRLESEGRSRESEAVLLQAREMARSVGSAYQESAILVNLGMNKVHKTRYDEAATYFEEASRAAGPQRTVLYTLARQNLAICYKNLGEVDRAIAIELESVKRQERSGAKTYLGLALGELGSAYLVKGDMQQAAKYMDRALTIALEGRSTSDAAIWASNLSGVYLAMGDLANAESLNEESIRLRKADKNARLYYNELNAGRIAVARGDREAAEHHFSQAMKDGKSDPLVTWEAQEGLGTLAVKQGRWADALQHFEAAVDIVEETRSSLDRTEFKLPFLTRLIRLYRQYVNALLQQGEVERALAVADSSRAQVLAERGGAEPVRRLPPDAYRKLARDSGTVLLSYWLTPERSHVWVVTAEGVHHAELPPAGEIEPLVAAYQEAVERQLADPARIQLPAGERLFALLVEPVRKWIPPGSRVVVAPDGALHGLNLESLPEPGDKPRYWLEDVTLSIAPSLALLRAKPGRKEEPNRLLLIGDPAQTDRSYPPLAYAAGEIADITRTFGANRSVVISGARATPDAWREAGPDAFSAIHFTAHATANAESPLDSGVLLAGGKLYARDVMATPLTANLVTVSACRGVGTRLYSGEGLVGFAWAFLHAGARNVIAGLWDVNDQSTSHLMDVLYRELAAGKSPAEALHAAKLALVATRGNLRKPYYWAPFQLYTVAP